MQSQLGGQLAQHVSSEKRLDTSRDDEGFVHAQFGDEAGEECVALVGGERAKKVEQFTCVYLSADMRYFKFGELTRVAGQMTRRTPGRRHGCSRKAEIPLR